MSEGEAPKSAADYEAELGRMRLQIVDAELRVEGVRRGMHDLDALKMLSEADRLGAAEQGGVEKAVANLRTEKPWLFTASTSAAARAPAAAPVAPVDAMKMSYEEWRTARAALLRRQGSFR